MKTMYPIVLGLIEGAIVLTAWNHNGWSVVALLLVLVLFKFLKEDILDA